MKGDESRIVKQIIKRYGPVLDLRSSPEVIIDIIRIFGSDDGGSPPGGAPEPPPGPTSRQGTITTNDLMKEILKLSREVKALAKRLG